MLRRIACRVRGARRSGGPLRFREPHFHYASAFERLTGDVYLDGYWQSERYFAAASSTVAKELTLAEPQDARNAELAARILSSDSVSVHVRRGDYVHDPTLAGLYAELSPDWYRRAALMAASGLAAPEFFVFSDDPDWVRGHLDFGHPLTVVDHNAGAPLADMRLMSLCGRHVIANSSFSWWGAWLDRRPGAVVLAPAKWFGPRRARRRIDDLYPATWRRT
nr:alpha-1,2-fucosyltransferase [Desulfobaculum xiamenense]